MRRALIIYALWLVVFMALLGGVLVWIVTDPRITGQPELNEVLPQPAHPEGRP